MTRGKKTTIKNLKIGAVISAIFVACVMAIFLGRISQKISINKVIIHVAIPIPASQYVRVTTTVTSAVAAILAALDIISITMISRSIFSLRSRTLCAAFDSLASVWNLSGLIDRYTLSAPEKKAERMRKTIRRVIEEGSMSD